jgi:hypothetical protein
VIRFDCHEPGSTSHSDLIATGILEITLNGVSLDPETVWADGRITLPALAARNIAAGGIAPGLARIVEDHRDTAARALRARALESSSGRTDGHALCSHSPTGVANHEREVRALAGRQK